MTDWFIYDDSQYYPSAAIVPAATAEDAAIAYADRYRTSAMLVVLPVSAIALVANDTRGKFARLRDEWIEDQA